VGYLELYVDGFSRPQNSGGDQHQRVVWHLPPVLGLLDLPGLQRRHRPYRAIRRPKATSRSGLAFRSPPRPPRLCSRGLLVEPRGPIPLAPTLGTLDPLPSRAKPRAGAGIRIAEELEAMAGSAAT
jgi:hypothetical protein